ncbi:hypothetical protein BAUCODRAFT_151152 [Baudoinia panamericana UAMH 10762]|uniref:Xylanolytic transcriptional activator regulatory domain-containing protein n=1 Tax=Baudoinia panamericana (strain UAMH 10762) TaxID=717646 RepID=M2N237_BAUPA|nr:uncharacterized protein BAUCODRAFT_151152 [Baudoinia panamericana UAMH 10762]EMC92740.1 hypothetical protein BAUCODRAFT_151152 [Baudoinia panamericana UAMH 10762]
MPIEANGAGDLTRVPRKRTSELNLDERQPSKRSRVSRACDQWFVSRECTYHEQPKKRGIQPNYIRTLELSLAWVLRHSTQVEHRLATELASLDPGDVRLTITGKDAAAAEELHQQWRNSLISRQIDQLLSGRTVECPYPTTTETPVSPQPSVNVSQQTPDPQSHTNLAHSRPDLELYYLDPSLGSRHDEPVSGPSVSERPELPANAWTFLEYYFAFTHSWLPITDKQEMLKLMYAMPLESEIFDGKAFKAGYAELWSIMALVSAQLQHEDIDQTQRLRETVNKMLPQHFRDYELSHVKALIILALLEISESDWFAAWMLIGSAIRLISVMQADDIWSEKGDPDRLRPDAKSLSHSQKTRLIVVRIAAIMVERMIGSAFNFPGHSLQTATDIETAIKEDDSEEWAPWSDPFGAPGAIKTPSRPYEALNRVLRLGASTDTERSQQLRDAVLALIQNATQTTARKRPLDILTDLESQKTRLVLANNTAGTVVSEIHESPRLRISDHIQDRFNFIPIPEDHGIGVAEDHALFATGAAAGPSAWAADSMPQEQGFMAAANSTNRAMPMMDIFEEFAMLERTDTGQHPQFMQNLGFGPDVDLAEFFGSDIYQPSDPLLAYMQPPFSTRMAEQQRQSGAEPG